MFNLISVSKKLLPVSTQQCRIVKLLSTQSAVKEVEKVDDKKFKQQLKEFEKISKISNRARIKLPQRRPFMKNTFLGEFDTEMLTYPEVTNEDLDTLTKSINDAEEYFARDCSQTFEDSIENLRQLQLFGLQASQLLGARELNMIESCKVLEAISNNTSIAALFIHNEYLGIEAVTKLGTDKLKEKYLPQLVNGKLLAAFCAAEEAVSDQFMNTKAVQSSDKNSWILNGKKANVLNGNSADVYVVLACSRSVMIGSNKAVGQNTLFLVDRDSAGVRTNSYEALDGNKLSEVIFEDVCIPEENILGVLNNGDREVGKLLVDFRLATGPACISLTKKLLNSLTDYCLKIETSTPISDTEIIQATAAQITLAIYMMESMTYLTAMLRDKYENQDCELESLIVKVFSAEQALTSTRKVIELLGASTLDENHWACKYHKNALRYNVLGESMENLKVVISLLGLQHAGRELQTKVSMIRNPFFFPWNALKRHWTLRRQAQDNPKYKHHLEEYLHPSAIAAAKQLEYCVLRLQFSVETLLARHGAEIINKHMDLKRLAECAVYIYAMTASLGRASRSYCIGLENSEHEMVIASMICEQGADFVKNVVGQIHKGGFSSKDPSCKYVSERLFKRKGYFPVHPLSRNF